jgi:hypothetical protein
MPLDKLLMWAHDIEHSLATQNASLLQQKFLLHLIELRFVDASLGFDHDNYYN